MDKIILLILFGIFGSVTQSNAELRCFVCTDCPDELDSNRVETCATDDPGITTTDPEDTTSPDTTTTEESTTPTTVTTPIITQTTPETLPTTTSQAPDTTTTAQTTENGVTTQPPPTGIPSTTTQAPVFPPDFLGHKYKEIKRQLLSDYRCFVVHDRVDDTVRVNRGCVLFDENHDQTCLRANSGVEPEFCRICETDECNGASTTAVSVVIVLSSLLLTLSSFR